VISAAECLQRAREAAQLARLVRRKEEKNALFGMARAWETLSKHVAQYDKALQERRHERCP
jgi:hypothetical protein